MSFFSKRPAVKVVFIDAATGSVFAQAEMDAESLPESFRLATQMTLAGEDWVVLKAEPELRPQFAALGELRLTMRRAGEERVVALNPKNIRFSLPTVDASLPSTRPGPTKGGKSVLHIHEDDWRQAEFVSFAHADAIQALFKEIVRVWESELSGGGFPECVARDTIRDPLAEAIRADEASQLFAAGGEILDGIAIPSLGSWVDFPFAVRSRGGIVLYGDHDRGRLASLCVIRDKKRRPPGEELQRLADFAAARKLWLIDWVDARPYKPRLDHYSEFFGGNGA